MCDVHKIRRQRQESYAMFEILPCNLMQPGEYMDWNDVITVTTTKKSFNVNDVMYIIKNPVTLKIRR